MTFDLEPRTEQILDVANELDSIAAELRSSRQCEVPANHCGPRLHELSRRLERLSTELARSLVENLVAQRRTREALEAGERQFRSLAENLPIYLARYSPQAEVLYLNPRLALLFGCTLSEAVGRTPTQFCLGERVEEYQDGILETARTGIEGRVELRLAAGDAQQCSHEVYLFADRDESGETTSVLSIAFDVTERRRTERDLKKALELAEGIITAIPDVLLEVDRDGRYLNVWSHDSETRKYSREALIGRTVGEVLSPQHAATVMQAIREADSQRSASGHVAVADLPDGSRRWFEHSFAKKLGDSPITDTFLMLARDVTARVQAEQARDAAHARLLSVLRTIPDMVWLKDTNGAYLLCNHAFERLVGRKEHEIVGKTDYDLFNANLADFFRAKDHEAIEARRICINEEWVTYHSTGKRALLETRKVPVIEVEGNVSGVLGVACDITEHRSVQETLARRECEFRTLVEHSPDVVVRYGKDFRRLYVNPTFAALIDGGETAVIGRKPTELADAPHTVHYEQMLEEVFANGADVEFEVMWERGRVGQRSCYLVKLVPERGSDGAVDSVLAVGRDITELYEFREKIHQLAFYDSLTDLANRVLFSECLRQAVADASPAGTPSIGVAMIDVDRFKGVNDTMGHAAGDQLLREAAGRLRGCVGSADIVARFGSDEFAILLLGKSAHRELEDIARKIIDCFDRPFDLGGKDMFVSCSIGIALYPGDSLEPCDLIKFADLAMYQAKRSGRRSFRFYSTELTIDATARLHLESELRGAVERRELELYYQPKVSFRDSEVIGSEALLRWHRPGVGLVSPDQFIPIAEETGLIAELGTWVLREACRTATEWNAVNRRCHKVAVNLSARQFQFQDFAEIVEQILLETDCRPEWLEFEITESLLLEEDATVLETLSIFRSMGISIAIDDFGTGYSALGYLARYPIDTLKIDRSFVQNVMTDQRHAELVKAIMSIARCLGQEVVAEGVETIQQAAFLASSGCQIAQGYLYAKPLTKREMASCPKYLRPIEPASAEFEHRFVDPYNLYSADIPHGWGEP